MDLLRFPQDFQLYSDRDYPLNILKESHIPLNYSELEKIYFHLTDVQKFVFNFLTSTWLSKRDIEIVITQRHINKIGSNKLPKLPQSLLKLMKEPSRGFYTRLGMFLGHLQISIEPSDLESSIWTMLVVLHGVVPFIKKEGAKASISTFEVPEPIFIYRDSKVFRNEAVIAHIHQIIEDSFELAENGTRLVRKSIQEPGDKIPITKDNIGLLISGKWVPSCLSSENITDRLFVKVEGKNLYSINLNSSPHGVVFTSKEVGSLIITEIINIFGEKLNIEIPEI